MGVKGESGHQRAPPTASATQIRFAQLTTEGKSTDDDVQNIQTLIKKVRLSLKLLNIINVV